MRHPGFSVSGSATVAAPDEPVIEIGTAGAHDVISLHIANTGQNTLDECVLQVKRHPDAPYVDYLRNPSDWTVTNKNVLFRSRDPTTLQPGQAADIDVVIPAAIGLRLLCSASQQHPTMVRVLATVR